MIYIRLPVCLFCIVFNTVSAVYGVILRNLELTFLLVFVLPLLLLLLFVLLLFWLFCCCFFIVVVIVISVIVAVSIMLCQCLNNSAITIILYAHIHTSMYFEFSTQTSSSATDLMSCALWFLFPFCAFFFLCFSFFGKTYSSCVLLSVGAVLSVLKRCYSVHLSCSQRNCMAIRF